MNKPPFNNFWFWLSLALLILLLFRSCNNVGSFFQCNGKRDTLSVTHDTTIVEVKGDTVYVPEATVITNTVTKWYKVTDTVETFEVRIDPADTVAILADYNKTRFYRDEQKLQRGSVIISDSVSRNRITSRRLQSFNTDTTITNTVTLSQPKRIVGYFSMSAFGNLHDPFAGAGIGFSLKGRNDVIYGVEYKIIRDNRPMYEGKVMLPIHLIKRKP